MVGAKISITEPNLLHNQPNHAQGFVKSGGSLNRSLTILTHGLLKPCVLINVLINRCPALNWNVFRFAKLNRGYQNRSLLNRVHGFKPWFPFIITT